MHILVKRLHFCLERLLRYDVLKYVQFFLAQPVALIIQIKTLSDLPAILWKNELSLDLMSLFD